MEAERGGTVALATFTIRHHAGHTLAAQWKAFKCAWRRMTSHRTWKQAKGELFDHAYAWLNERGLTYEIVEPDRPLAA